MRLVAVRRRPVTWNLIPQVDTATVGKIAGIAFEAPQPVFLRPAELPMVANVDVTNMATSVEAIVEASAPNRLGF